MDSRVMVAVSTACARRPYVLLRNESGTILFAGDAICRLLKYGQGELHGQRLELLIPERFRPSHIGHRLRFVDEPRARPMGGGLELFALCKDGSERRVDVSLELSAPPPKSAGNCGAVG